MNEWTTEIGHRAILLTMMISAPLLLSGLMTGVLVSLFQAVTQINEQTLSFIPKIVIMAGVFILAGPWISDSLQSFTRELIINIPQYILAD